MFCVAENRYGNIASLLRCGCACVPCVRSNHTHSYTYTHTRKKTRPLKTAPSSHRISTTFYCLSFGARTSVTHIVMQTSACMYAIHSSQCLRNLDKPNNPFNRASQRVNFARNTQNAGLMSALCSVRVNASHYSSVLVARTRSRKTMVRHAHREKYDDWLRRMLRITRR